MAREHSSRNNAPITQQQKQTLISVYQQTGNMTQAMRASGIASPRTAYLWWHRFCEAGEEALQPRSHARKTQNRLPEALVEEICQMRSQQPDWGRRRIAEELARRHGEQVVSPASVESILRRANLWEQASRVAEGEQSAHKPAWMEGGFDYDGLLETVQRGIWLSIHSEARAASQLLSQQVWSPLKRDPTLYRRLLTTPEMGSWLFSSRLHLGHSLMNSGRWSCSTTILRETIDWMQEFGDTGGTRRRPWEDEPQMVSLRRDDIWLGCYHHLGLTLGKYNEATGIAYLQTALSALQRFHRPVIASDQTVRGSLERDLANLKLRMRAFSETEVLQHLHYAQQNADQTGNRGVQVYTCITWARLYDRLVRAAGDREKGTRRQHQKTMQRFLERAIELVETEQEDADRPMRQTMCFLDTALLAQAHGMPVDAERLRRAAQYCLTYGYGHQAEKLLAMPDNHLWLSEVTQHGLAKLISQSR
jgi:hypothetical protein